MSESKPHSVQDVRDLLDEELHCIEPISRAIGESCGECVPCQARAALRSLEEQLGRLRLENSKNVSEAILWKQSAEGLKEQLQAAESRLNSGIFMGHPAEYWIGLQEQLEAMQKALNDACEVAIWLSALIGGVVDGDSPEVHATWQNSMRPKLFAALNLASNPTTSSGGAGTMPDAGHEAPSEASSPASSPRGDFHNVEPRTGSAKITSEGVSIQESKPEGT